MGRGAARVLAVTSNHALVVGLSFLDRGWDVVNQRDLSDEIDADVLVLDLGDTQAALSALAANTDSGLPTLVIGDDTSAALPEAVRLLVRPFAMEQLAEEIDAMVAGRKPPRGRRPPADVTTPSRPDVADPGPVSEAIIDLTDAPDSGLPDGGSTPSTSVSDGAPQRNLESWAKPVVQLPKPEPQLASQQPPARVGPASVPATSTSEPTSSRWFARRIANSPNLDDPDAADRAELELERRLEAVLAGLIDLDQLVEEVPLLRSVPALSAAIVHELRSMLDADTAALWERTDDGWQVVACLGLTPYESRTPVPADQPLMAEVDATGGALLIDPIDQVQAAVAGIGGAHVRSFMAAAVVVADENHGIATVGRQQPLTDADLDALVGLAREAAPGLAVARHLADLCAAGGGESADDGLEEDGADEEEAGRGEDARSGDDASSAQAQLSRSAD